MEGLQRSSYGTMGEGKIEDSWLQTSSPLRMVLVGKTGCGKSATGNSILCQPAFESRLGAQAVTRKCQEATGTCNGRPVLLVDTPPIFEPQAPTPERSQAIWDCYLLCAPGPHVLLLVTQLGRFTPQDAEAARGLKEVFGPGAMRHVVVVFTHKEDLGDESLEDYLAHTDNERLHRVLRECGYRYCGFDNRAGGAEQAAQLAQLLAQVDALDREHQGAFLSNDLFFVAQRLRQEGDGAQPRGHHLAQVQKQLQKHRRHLDQAEGSWAGKALLRAKAWVRSHLGVSAVVIISILVFLAILINLCITYGH